MTADRQKLQAALTYAARGWRVIPLNTIGPDGRCSCGAAVCDSAGKHPRYNAQWLPNGLKDATTQRQLIERLWSIWPDANVGIVTGYESGLVALDVDPDHGGDDSLRDLEEAYGPLPATPESLTGGGGRHVLFAHPGDRVPNSAGKLGPGLDIRGDGGYIVAPPSMHKSGRVYAWDAFAHPKDVKLAALPEWMLARLAPKQERQAPALAGALPETIKNGGRNVTLTSLAGTLRRRHVAESVILMTLLEVNAQQCDPPLDREEVEQIAHSVAQYAPAPAGVALSFPHTDWGNAEMLAALFGERLRYDHRQGRWLLWSGGRWQVDPNGELTRLVVLTARERLKASATIEEEKERRAAISWATACENSQKIAATMKLAQDIPQLADNGDGWDADPWLLSCANGVVDLRTGALRPALPTDRLTMTCGVEYDPAATAPRFERFLSEVFDGNEDMVGFVQRAIGYSLTGDTREQCLFLCWGAGANGKSTLLDVLLSLVGDYGRNTPFSTFEQSEMRGTATNDIAALVGKRLVTASETAEAQRLNEARIKAVTGGDVLTGRFLYKELFTFTPMFKLWLAVNHRPRVTGTDDGIWRRLRLVPFTVSFRGREDKTLKDTLRAELPGILAWAIAGALAWQAEGLAEPAQVLEATQDYRNESDAVWRFIQDSCLTGAQYVTGASEIYQAYKAWAKANGENDSMSKNDFGVELARQPGIVKGRSARGNNYRGVGLASGTQVGMV